MEEICKQLMREYWDPEMKEKKKQSSWDAPFNILISCLLSTRTKDEMTDKATKRLFSKFDKKSLANADEKEIEKLIYGVGFYHQKAKNVIKVAKILKNKQVPEDKEKLMELPGIGRKCAGVVRAYAFGIDDIPVDTHVNRISQRLGWTEVGTKPEETEKILKNRLQKKYWIPLNHCLVQHGRKVCLPRNPKCGECFLKKLCNYGRSR